MSNRHLPVITLQTDQGDFTGWEGISIKRSLTQMANTFNLSVTDAGIQALSQHPLHLDAACRVLIDGFPVINGFVGDIAPSIGDSDHALSVSGRDVTGDLVDCSAIVPNQEMHNVTLKEAADILCADYGIRVECPAPGEPFEKWAINDGETVFSNIESHSRQREQLLHTRGDAVLYIGKIEPVPINARIEEGVNLKQGSANHTNKDRFHKIITKSQQSGKPAESSEWIDEDVRSPRVRIVRAEKPVTSTVCKNRAHWESQLRKAKGTKASITVQGWYYAPGKLWDIRQTLPVISQRLMLNDTMMIESVNYEAGESGTLTKLELVPPEVYS